MGRNLAAETEERHRDKLPTPEDRRAYAQRMINAMESGAQALMEVAKALRKDPDMMLSWAFEPNITGMLPNTLAVVELTHFANATQKSDPFFTVRGCAIIDGSRFNEIGFRAAVTLGGVTPLKDNRIGV